MDFKLLVQFLIFWYSAVLTNGQFTTSGNSPELSCTFDQQCQFMFGEHSQCIQHKCVCWDTNQSVNTKCVYKNKSPKVTVLGFSCETDQNCRPENSICDSETKRCVCPTDGHSVESADRRRCLTPIPSVHAPCKDSNQCAALVQHMECSKDGACVCEDFFNFYNGSCIAKSSLHGGCFNDGNCNHISNATCQDRVCSCQHGFVPRLDGLQCLSIIESLGAPCSEHPQCEFHLGRGAACLEGACGCRDEFIENRHGTHCQARPYVGMECYETEDCNVPRRDGATNAMICETGSCRCSRDHFQRDQECLLIPSAAAKIDILKLEIILAGFVLLQITVKCY